MANFLEKLFGLQKTDQQTEVNELAKFHSFGDNLVQVPKSEEYPEHLIAHGRILRDKKPPIDIRTAINKRGDDIEFSTNLGQLPNTSLGEAIKERLSHRLDGKFVAFENQQEANKVDLVYATRKPYEWLNRERFERELENHAKTKDLLAPVLSASIKIGQSAKRLDYPSIKKIAQDIVDDNLELPQLNNKLASGQYLPNLQSKKKK